MSLFRRKKKVTSKPSQPLSSPSTNVNVMADDESGVSPPSPPQPRPSTVVWDLVWKKNWDEASRRCQTHPQDARYQSPGGYLPIHRACLKGAPLGLIRSLHEAYGDGVRKTDNTGNLPIHIYCYNGASLEVIEYLHGLHPRGAFLRSRDGYTPADRIRYNLKFSEEDKAAARAILSSSPDGS